MGNILKKVKMTNLLQSSKKTKYMFNSVFEEMKVYEYLRNLIDSKFLKHKPIELFKFANTIMGQEMIVKFLIGDFPELAAKEDFAEWIEYDRLNENLPNDVLTGLLKGAVLLYLSKAIKTLRSSTCSDDDTEKRFQELKRTFALTEEEMEVVVFFFLNESCSVVEDHLESNDLADFTDFSTLRSQGAALFGLKRKTFLNSISNGNLFKAEVIEKTHSNYIALADWGFDYLSGIGEPDLSHDLYKKEDAEALSISNFDVSGEEIDVIDTLIRNGQGQNILLYGAPGSGKTSFARSLAKKYGKELLSVKTPSTDKHEDRLRAIFGTINLTDDKRSIVLVDEADEILNSYESFFFKSKTNKSWVNNILESHRKTVIWITNRSSEIDESSMRRFSFSVEFKKPDDKRRLKVLQLELGKKGLGSFFDRKELSALCKNYQVDAGGIVNAINTVTISGGTGKEAALRKIETVLKNHEKATCRKKAVNQKERDFARYSLAGLNASHDLKDIVSITQKFVSSKDREAFRYNHSLTMLLHGMPGTGKSEFVYYLGDRLGKEILLKRCSEIQSKWVGETEKNIAAAFLEAEEKGSILFFDEADSFLFPRNQAEHSWEKDFTNEILTQIEAFKGITVFATNDMEGIDHAALRRFKFKVEFKALTPEGNLHFYNTLLKPLVPMAKRLSPAKTEAIKAIPNLTPGDFAVTKDQALFMEPSRVTHGTLIDSLTKEAAHKKTTSRLGF